MKDDRPYLPGSTFRRPRKGLNRVNHERRARREEADEVYGSHHRAIETYFPCQLADDPEGVPCGRIGDRKPIEGHHLKTVGAGGKDRNNQVGACNVHHDIAQRSGDISGQCERFKRDLKSIAVENTRTIDRNGWTDEIAEAVE